MLGGPWCDSCITKLTEEVYVCVGVVIHLRLMESKYVDPFNHAKGLVEQFPEGYSGVGHVALVLYVASQADLTDYKKLKTTIRDGTALSRLPKTGTDTLQLSGADMKRFRDQMKDD